MLYVDINILMRFDGLGLYTRTAANNCMFRPHNDFDSETVLFNLVLFKSIESNISSVKLPVTTEFVYLVIIGGKLFRRLFLCANTWRPL